MADNVSINTSTPGVDAPVATDDIGGVQYQRIKLTLGADGINEGDVSSTNPIPVELSVPDSLTQEDMQEALSILRRLVILLKPLGIVTGGGSNRLSIDVNSVTGNVAQVTLVPTVTTVGTVNTVANQTNIAGITAFELLKSANKSGLYAQRSNM